MAKRIYSLVQRIALLASQQGGYVSAQEIASHVATASQQAFNALIPAKGPRLGPGLNRELDTRLNVFLQTASYNTAPIKLPADCAYVDYYDVPGAVTVEEVNGAALLYRLNDPNCGPTERYPIVGARPGGVKQLYPASLAVATIQYYAYPTEPVYAETEPTEDTPAKYDDDASVDTGWGPELDPELIVRSLRLMGLEIRDPQLQGVAAQLTAETL